MELDFSEVLLEVMRRNASDLHMTAGSPADGARAR